ncbi:DivIVA domain-containing protein [Micromonospora narathiwatensis]|uniref:DivIVA domain-containing protein n=1 Tax=Micromonospora narathiwatensis TaxID=299146 RepID=A0A1A8ZL83_9ACTN|nr:DivIVA domain-containing protein [Micromonospora narathiwatensis]SBT44610.1 DivIVA domain-containing protein [Micromonospora narathiwatensis]
MNVRNQRPTPGSGGTTYRSTAYTGLLPWQVRERRFKPVGLGRRGLDPDDVYAFLDRVARDLAAVHAALAGSRRETAAIKDALRRWQSEHARARDAREDAR